MTEAEEFAEELDALCTKYFRRQQNLNIYDFMLQVATIYASFVRMAEEDCDEETLIKLREDATEIVANLIYGDGLLDDRIGVTN